MKNEDVRRQKFPLRGENEKEQVLTVSTNRRDSLEDSDERQQRKREVRRHVVCNGGQDCADDLCDLLRLCHVAFELGHDGWWEAAKQKEEVVSGQRRYVRVK